MTSRYHLMIISIVCILLLSILQSAQSSKRVSGKDGIARSMRHSPASATSTTSVKAASRSSPIYLSLFDSWNTQKEILIDGKKKDKSVVKKIKKQKGFFDDNKKLPPFFLPFEDDEDDEEDEDENEGESESIVKAKLEQVQSHSVSEDGSSTSTKKPTYKPSSKPTQVPTMPPNSLLDPPPCIGNETDIAYINGMISATQTIYTCLMNVGDPMSIPSFYNGSVQAMMLMYNNIQLNNLHEVSISRSSFFLSFSDFLLFSPDVD